MGLIEPLERRTCFGAWTLIAENVAQPWGSFHTGPDSFVAADGGAFYVGYDRTHGSELWHARPGAPARLVRDVRPGKKSSSIELLGASGPIVLFAGDDGAAGRSLWRSDGSAGGTFALRPIRAAGAGAALGGAFYFAADDGVHGAELWRTDGMRRGTVMLTDLRAGPGSTAPRHLTVAGGRIFFVGSDSLGVGLYATDGTKRGTVKLAGGVGGSYLNVAPLGGTFVIGNETNVWSTDGTSTRTTRALGAHLTWRNLVAGPRTVLFAGAGERLWETDGTPGGTRAVPGLPGAFDRVVGIGQAFGGAAVHTGSAIDGEVWFTDGTPGNSRRLVAGRASVFDKEHASFNDVHLFTHRGGYWQTDGTVAGSFLVPLAPLGAPLEGVLRLARGERHMLLISGSTLDPHPPGQGYLRKLWSYAPAASLGGVVFDDAGADGRLGSGDARLAGFRVYADADGNGRFDLGERWARTDARGAYHLTLLEPGLHRIRIVGAGGFFTRVPGWTVSLEPGEVERRYLPMSDA